MPDAYIVSAVRSPVGRSGKGSLRTTRPDDLGALALQEALRRVPGVEAAEIEDVLLGCAMPEAEQGFNLARIASLRAGLPPSVAAATVNRFCASGLEAVAIASERIRSGASAILAGGAESMSLVPVGGFKPSANPWLIEHDPESYLNMGLTAERVATAYNIRREDADAFSLRSHQNALRAQAEGKFDDELFPVDTVVPSDDNAGGEMWRPLRFTADEGPRADTTLEKLAALKPVFMTDGQVTAGNSSQTSDGAAAALVVSEDFLRSHNLQPWGRLVSYATAGVAPALMGIGPVYAIPRALKRAGLRLDQVDVIELNEAFAAQSVAVIREAGLDPDRVNVNGGAIALGHPLGCTGAKLLATILSELRRRRARYGMITMCVGGGMGAAGIVENLRT